MSSLGIEVLVERLGARIETVRHEVLALCKAREIGRLTRSAPVKLADGEKRITGGIWMRDARSTLLRSCPGHGEVAEGPILETPGGQT